MAVGQDTLPRLHPIGGIRLAAVAAGVRRSGHVDLAAIEMAAAGGTAAAVFTTNRFRAAPVRIAEAHLRASVPRYLLINTGNANAGTGAQGDVDARHCCLEVARQTGCEEQAVLPFSTGVIGEPLPVAPIVEAMPQLLSSLHADGWAEVAAGIGTTDTRPKGASERVDIDGRTVTLTGVAKGAGMIRPNMATMLAFIGTDAAFVPSAARRALRDAVAYTFNRITVDGDTSTNDACTLLASGASGVAIETIDSEAYSVFVAALTRICRALARAVVRDGEGATREIEMRVTGAASEVEAERVAFTVAESPLVKTAVFAGDPNWGRLLAAVGRTGIDDLDVEAVRIALGDYVIAEHGGRAASYQESEAVARMAGEKVPVSIDLGRGSAAATVWSCDFSYDYIRINADYRT